MKLRRDWPVNVSQHAHERLFERFGEKGKIKVVEAFRCGAGVWRQWDETFQVTHGDLVIIAAIKNQTYMVVTIITKKMIGKDKTFLYSDKNRRTPKHKMSREEREDIDDARSVL